MGYASNQLGDYRQVSTGKVLSDSLYSLLSRSPGFRSSDWVKVVITGPIPVVNPTVPHLVATGTGPVAPTPAAPVAPAPTPVQTAAPIVAAAAGPVVGPIAAAIPPIVDAATQPPPTRIRIVPDAAAPSVSLSPVPSSPGGASVPDTSLPDVSEASVAAPGNPLAMLKSLPPAALAAGAGLVLFLLSRRS